MWPWVMEAKRARAEKERMDVIEDILWLGMAAKPRSRRSLLNRIRSERSLAVVVFFGDAVS